MRILNRDIAPGSSHKLEMDVATLHTRTKINIPVFIERAKENGPCLLLIAGIHGDEINGVETLRRTVRDKLNVPKKGTTITIPIFNIFGYLNHSRYFPDGKDLNRVFPGNANGSLASQFAYHLRKEILPHVNYALDFHTGGADRYNVAQVRFDFADPSSKELAQAFGAPFIIHSTKIQKSIRETFQKQKIINVIFEGGKTNYISDKMVECGYQGVQGVMNFLGMRSEKIKSNTSKIIKKSTWHRAPYSGMFRSFVEAGSTIEKGEIIGEITDPFGLFERKIKSPYSGCVICTNTAPVVHKGDAIFRIGFIS
ncbi:MAG: M14 family metallopeptidase [Flavobacteriales bacterium]|nr:M14 family metallopeptidase [Flavobacteriales bacterium]